MITWPSLSIPTVTGDSCGVPSALSVLSTAWCCVRMYSMAALISMALSSPNRSALAGRLRLLLLIGGGRPAGEQVQGVLRSAARLGAVAVEDQARVGDEFKRLVGQADVPDDRVVEMLDSGAVLAHVVVGPAEAEDVARGGDLADQVRQPPVGRVTPGFCPQQRDDVAGQAIPFLVERRRGRV